MTEISTALSGVEMIPPTAPGLEAAFTSLSRERWPLTLSRLSEGADELRRGFEAAAPFPHVVIDGVFDSELLDGIAAEFPDPGDTDWRASGSPNGGNNPWGNVADLGGPLTHILAQRASAKSFIDCLQAITGIKGLIWGSQPTLQQAQRADLLAAHVDGMKSGLTGLHFRLTVLLFLNRDWSESYGGDFELWNEDASICVKRIAPIFNRLVIFVNTDNSYHGFPKPMEGTQGVCRRSILLRYLTAKVPGEEGAAPEKRNFGPRNRPPQSNAIRNTLHRIAPPILVDAIRKLRPKP